MTPRHEVALHVLHLGLDLALGLCSVVLAQPWCEAPVTGEAVKRSVQARFALRGSQHNGTHTIVKQKLATPAEHLSLSACDTSEPGKLGF